MPPPPPPFHPTHECVHCVARLDRSTGTIQAAPNMALCQDIAPGVSGHEWKPLGKCI